LRRRHTAFQSRIENMRTSHVRAISPVPDFKPAAGLRPYCLGLEQRP